MAESEPREDEAWGEAWIMVRTDRDGIGRLLVSIDPDHTGRDDDMTRFPPMMRGRSSVVAGSGLTEDESGSSLNVDAPIKTADGRIVALLGYDGPAGPLDRATPGFVLTGLALFIAMISAAGLVSPPMRRRLTRPVTLLSSAIEQVAAGDLTTTVPVGEALMGVRGDASGHGVPVALVMASTRSTVRAFLRDDNPDLAVLLHRVKEQPVHDTPAAAFFTLALLRIDRTTGPCLMPLPVTTRRTACSERPTRCSGGHTSWPPDASPICTTIPASFLPADVLPMTSPLSWSAARATAPPARDDVSPRGS